MTDQLCSSQETIVKLDLDDLVAKFEKMILKRRNHKIASNSTFIVQAASNIELVKEILLANF